MCLELMLLIPTLVFFTMSMCMPIYATLQSMKSVTDALNAGMAGNGPICVGGEEFAMIDFSVSEKGCVYLVPAESVYHTKRSCGNLQRTIHVGLDSIMGQLRNNSRKRYMPCGLCKRERGLPLVYYTAEGERYHRDRFCASLHRTVYCIPLTEISGREECALCQKR